MLATFLLHGGEIPPAWLRKTPYDSIIRLAQSLTRQPEYAALIRKLILQYKNASPSGADIDRKLELLAARLSAVLPDGPNSTTNQMSQKTKAGTP
jgi:hypothetical protein